MPIPHSTDTHALSHIDAARLLCVMATVAFASFLAVDPFMVTTSLEPFIKVRGVMCAGCLALLAMTWTPWGSKRPTVIGIAVGVWTGFGVVILTEMTGGAQSPYWTMVMLTFFTVALILPMSIPQALLCFGSTALFYDAWMLHNDATSSMNHWAGSNAGVWLSMLVSVGAVGYLKVARTRREADHLALATLNTSLRNEIRERERAERLFRRSQQLDAVGRLAAGMAHELNNVLMIISGAAESLQRRQGDLQKQTTRIVNSALRGGRLTGDLLLFAREGQFEMAPLSMNVLVEEVAETIKTGQKGRLTVLTETASEDLWVRGDPALIRQVLLNLCLNSVHAMQSSGTLTLSTALGQTQDTIHVAVSDTGTGMEAHVLERVFEPFFTTKAQGEGTGLGLSMVFGTVKDHDGEIDIDTELGAGTKVTIALPRLHPPPEAPTTATALELRLGPNTILLIDDDETVCRVIKELLTDMGQTVLSATSAQEGLACYRAQHEAIDLVILDVSMPHTSGDEVFEAIRAFEPNQAILFCSGHALDESIQRRLSLNSSAYLQKPFKAKTLAHAISELTEKTGT